MVSLLAGSVGHKIQFIEIYLDIYLPRLSDIYLTFFAQISRYLRYISRGVN
jgi:hypothetical protein